ncbi:unnamed protein product [Rotaria magnacalcarata]|uniref:Uncharacterized protein n=1 Tax=Rotaria magnacalcarata TaxID=392030 RepID=A0A816K901_9BILA|nr:unnamed protein product [Rotaria magnacalcarata]CAF1261288.1 unnamed protein product [Rotaria magnacalcarata]CAF1915009.1 unnamed protein product [Rotaria magnacalcarata]
MDFNVLKLLCFVYKGKIFSHYDKIILTSHWTLIDSGFRVFGQDEKENVIFDFYRDEFGVVAMFRIRFEFNDDQNYKWFSIEYKNFINDKDDDVEYAMLPSFVQKLNNKLHSILKELIKTDDEQ